jgi:hypothetical protein
MREMDQNGGVVVNCVGGGALVEPVLVVGW